MSVVSQKEPSLPCWLQSIEQVKIIWSQVGRVWGMLQVYRVVSLMNLIFGRASDLYLCLYNQLFALFHYVFKFLTP